VGLLLHAQKCSKIRHICGSHTSISKNYDKSKFLIVFNGFLRKIANSVALVAMILALQWEWMNWAAIWFGVNNNNDNKKCAKRLSPKALNR
jgi:hypothetical protein